MDGRCYVHRQCRLGELPTTRRVYSFSNMQTMSTVAHFLLAMMDHPDVLEKLQREIDTVVGRDRLPSFSDRAKLPYSQCLLSCAMSPALPLTPHLQWRPSSARPGAGASQFLSVCSLAAKHYSTCLNWRRSPTSADRGRCVSRHAHPQRLLREYTFFTENFSTHHRYRFSVTYGTHHLLWTRCSIQCLPGRSSEMNPSTRTQPSSSPTAS
jgi:hypothetical protein